MHWAQTPSHLCTISGGHVGARGGGTPGACPRRHPAAAPTALQVNQEGQGRAVGGSQGRGGSGVPLYSYSQDSGIPAEAPGPHGKTQCQHQHACPQPGHRLGTQPATVRWQLTSLPPTTPSHRLSPKSPPHPTPSPGTHPTFVLLFISFNIY